MTNRTTPPTEAELDELLGKPGAPIQVDPEQLAAEVALQRAEAQSQTTAMTAPIWATEDGTIEVMPESYGIKIRHHGNRSVVWLEEAEAIDLALKVLAHCRITP